MFIHCCREQKFALIWISTKVYFPRRPRSGFKPKKSLEGSAAWENRGDQMARNSPRFSSTRTEDNMEALNKRKGMVLPFEPHSMTFDETQYYVDMPQFRAG